MSILSKRLAKLENITNGGEDLIVVLQRFGGDGEYVRVKGEHGLMVDRHKGESEDDLLKRAGAEIVSQIKAAHGPKPVYVLQPLRVCDRELETEPQLRPRLTKEEWLRAYGISNAN